LERDRAFIKFVISCNHFRKKCHQKPHFIAKVHQIYFWLGSAPNPAGEHTTFPQTPSRLGGHPVPRLLPHQRLRRLVRLLEFPHFFVHNLSSNRNSDKQGPAVARVSRPYSWCTLTTCVHNCPSMMFRTCCCLRPKCKRSYLLIYITSDTS